MLSLTRPRARPCSSPRERSMAFAARWLRKEASRSPAYICAMASTQPNAETYVTCSMRSATAWPRSAHEMAWAGRPRWISVMAR